MATNYPDSKAKRCRLEIRIWDWAGGRYDATECLTAGLRAACFFCAVSGCGPFGSEPKRLANGGSAGMDLASDGTMQHCSSRNCRLYTPGLLGLVARHCVAGSCA